MSYSARAPNEHINLDQILAVFDPALQQLKIEPSKIGKQNGIIVTFA